MSAQCSIDRHPARTAVMATLIVGTEEVILLADPDNFQVDVHARWIAAK
jgi:hypothetical protein